MKKQTFIYKKLPTAIKLPEELQHDIDRYIDYLNQGGELSEDCYQMEILTSINWCIREELLPIELIQKLKAYYIRGGIHTERGV